MEAALDIEDYASSATRVQDITNNERRSAVTVR